MMDFISSLTPSKDGCLEDITGPFTLKFHMLILETGQQNRSGPDFVISEGYPKKLISYTVEALSLAHSLILSL